MEGQITNRDIVNFLKQNFKDAGFVDGLKIKYRSYICPFQQLLSLIKPGDKVGDIGCGSGQFLLLTTRFSKPSSVYGIEITPRLIDNANALFSEQDFKNYKFEVFDGSTLPDTLGEMDILFLIDVIHHVPPQFQESFLKNICGKMKSGARLILKDINGGSPLVLFNKMHDMVFAGEIGKELSVNKANNLLRSYGMEILEESKRTMYVYPHYTLVAKKP